MREYTIKLIYYVYKFCIRCLLQKPSISIKGKKKIWEKWHKKNIQTYYTDEDVVRATFEVFYFLGNKEKLTKLQTSFNVIRCEKGQWRNCQQCRYYDFLVQQNSKKKYELTGFRGTLTNSCWKDYVKVIILVSSWTKILIQITNRYYVWYEYGNTISEDILFIVNT